MEVVLTKKYIKQHSKSPAHIKEKCRLILLELQEAKSLSEINEVKQLSGFKNYFRIRVSDYRIGVEQKKPKVIILCLLERSQIYKVFPPNN
jgi:mRNA interferase RelE/StbE